MAMPVSSPEDAFAEAFRRLRSAAAGGECHRVLQCLEEVLELHKLTNAALQLRLHSMPTGTALAFARFHEDTLIALETCCDSLGVARNAEALLGVIDRLEHRIRQGLSLQVVRPPEFW